MDRRLRPVVSALLAVALSGTLAPPARAGFSDGPSGGVGVSYQCEGASDSSFTAGASQATDGLVYDFGGGSDFARTQLGYSAVFTNTVVAADTRIVLPSATAAGDCSVGGSLNMTQPFTFTGVVTDTVQVQLQAVVDGWLVEVPDGAPSGTDAAFSFQVDLGGGQLFESFVVTPALGVVPGSDPGAWIIDPLGGGRFSVSGTTTISATVGTSSPPVLQLFADHSAFVPAGGGGISVTNSISDAFRYQVVSLQPGVSVVPLGIEPEVDDPQTTPQQKCLVALNKAAAKVVKAQLKLNEKCLKDATRGKEPSAQNCVLVDPKGKVQKAAEKVMRADERKCTKDSEQLPGFSYVAGTALYIPAMDEAIVYLADLLGPSADAAIRSDRSEVGCQGAVLKAGDKHLVAILKEAVKAKKAALRAGAASPAQLQAAIEAALAASAKLSKQAQKVAGVADKKCSDVADLGAVLPGVVVFGVTPADAAGVAVDAGRCRACSLLNAFDELAIDCDAFDDGAPNGSCP